MSPTLRASQMDHLKDVLGQMALLEHRSLLLPLVTLPHGKSPSTTLLSSGNPSPRLGTLPTRKCVVVVFLYYKFPFIWDSIKRSNFRIKPGTEALSSVPLISTSLGVPCSRLQYASINKNETYWTRSFPSSSFGSPFRCSWIESVTRTRISICQTLKSNETQTLKFSLISL